MDESRRKLRWRLWILVSLQVILGSIFLISCVLVMEIGGTVLFGIPSILYFTGAVGLLRYRPWARRLSLVVFALGTVFAGFFVLHLRNLYQKQPFGVEAKFRAGAMFISALIGVFNVIGFIPLLGKSAREAFSADSGHNSESADSD